MDIGQGKNIQRKERGKHGVKLSDIRSEIQLMDRVLRFEF